MASNKVLIVDDNASMRTELEEMLPGGKFEILEAEDGKSALYTIKEERQNLRLIILKFKLPHVNGWKVVEQMKLHPKLQEIPVVLYAEAGDPVTEKLPNPLLYFEILVRPFDRKHLQRAIKTAISKSELTPVKPPATTNGHSPAAASISVKEIARPAAQKAHPPTENPLTVPPVSKFTEHLAVSETPSLAVEEVPFVQNNGQAPTPEVGTIPYQDFVCLHVHADRSAHQISSLAISSDGFTLVSGSEENAIACWDLYSLTKILQFGPYSKGVSCVAISPDGHTLYTGSQQSNLKRWRLTTGSLLGPVNERSADLIALAMAPDGQILASSSTKSNIRLWDLNSGELLQHFNGSTGMSAIVITPDGQRLLSGANESNIKFWSLATGELLGPLNIKSFGVTALTISPDGQWVISGDQKGMVSITNLTSGELLRTFDAHHSQPVKAIAISPNGWYIVSASDAELKLWGINS